MLADGASLQLSKIWESKKKRGMKFGSGNLKPYTDVEGNLLAIDLQLDV